VAHATADIGTTDYAVSLLAGHHRLMSDEGAAIGGKDAGPAPHELLCAARALSRHRRTYTRYTDAEAGCFDYDDLGVTA
jgi:hypothetical protein